MIMQSCASVVSGTALASMAVVTGSVVSSKLSAKANPWIPAVVSSELSATANPGFPVDRPKSENLSNVDDTVDSGITQVVVNGNYYQRVDKDDTPRSNRGPCTLLGDHVYKVFEDDIEHHGIVVDSFLEKDSWIEIFQVKYDDGQTEDLYPDQFLFLDRPRREITGNSIAGNDNDVKKEAAQDVPGEYVPFLSTHEAYDQSVLPYPNPSTGFLPDNPDSGKPWILVGGPNTGQLKNMDDTAVSGSKQGVVVTNYYQSLYKDDTPVEEDSVFSSISDNKIKNIKENLDEGEDVTTINKKKKKKKKKKKEPKEKESTVPRKYEYSVDGKQDKDKSVLPAQFLSSVKAYGPNSGELSNVVDTMVTGTKQVVVNGNYYQRVDKDDTPGINKQPPLLLGRHVYKMFEHDVEHHGIVIDSASEKDSMITVFQVMYDDGQTEDLYLDQVLLLDKPSGGGSKNVDVDVDVGLLQIRERHLDSVEEDCAATCNNWNRPVIETDGESFRELLMRCTAEDECPDYLYYEDVPIGCWDTSKVTYMKSAFHYEGYYYDRQLNPFNKAINCWNTASVINMERLFYKAIYFNQPLDDWNVASVNNMAFMFSSATNFNQPLEDWNVASVTTMRFMFKDASEFNQSLNDWNVASVNSMYRMFQGNVEATSFNQPLDDWNVASVKDMKMMFDRATHFDQPLIDWNVASVTSMDRMFREATNFNQPLNDWDVARVIDMYHMFTDASAFNQCLSSWASKTPTDVDLFNMLYRTSCPNTEPVESVGPWCQGEDEQCLAPSESPSISSMPSSSNMPSSTPSISLMPSNVDVRDDCTLCTSSTVITDNESDFKDLVSSCYDEVYNPFSACPDDVPIGCWDTSEVTDMAYAFDGLTEFNQSINCWNVEGVNNMTNMFRGATSFNQPLNDWDVANVNKMYAMFSDATNFNQCLSTWADKTPPDVNVGYIFYYSDCPNEYPDPSVGPWCQGEDEQCLAPSDAITDPPTSAPSASPTSAPSASPTSVPSALLTSTTSTPPTVGPVALPTEVPTAGSIARPTAGPIAKQKKTSKKSKK